MSSIPPQDRVSLCRYSYADQRQCRTPRSPRHAHFCYFHARREAQSVAAKKLSDDLAYFFSGHYISANDLSAALGRLMPAVVRGDIKPSMARTVAYLAQTMLQTIRVSQKEYIYGFGTPQWGAKIRNNVNGNLEHLNETDPDTPALNAQSTANSNANQPAPNDPETCSGGSSDRCSCGSSATCNPESEEQEENEQADQNEQPENDVDSAEDSNNEDTDEQIEPDESNPTPEPACIDEPLTLVEATLTKN